MFSTSRKHLHKVHHYFILPLQFFTIDAGVDIICAQGGEGGGHTGDTAFSILIPAVVDLCKNAKSPLTGEPVVVVAAGGIADGRGLAASLS
jgi:NAD(P)H-dependent flavin oxidoreductase YrpB (nitropropane dioxygenase family)